VYLLKIMNSVEWGGGEKRIRAWIVAIEIEKSGLDREAAMDFLKNTDNMLKKFHDPKTTLDFHKIMLKAKDKYVMETLKRMQAAKAESDQKAEPEVEDPVWRSQVNQILVNKNLSASQIQVPDHVRSSPWHAVLPMREKATIGLNLAVYPTATSFDVSQMPVRCFIGCDNVLNTVATGAHIWDVKGNRLILGRELLNGHGFPYHLTDLEVLDAAELNDRHLCELAGNSFAGNIFAAILIAVLTFFPHDSWKPGMTETEQEEDDKIKLKKVERFLDDILFDAEFQ